MADEDYYPIYDLKFVTGDYVYRDIRFMDPDPDSIDPENPDMIPRVWTGWSGRAQVRANPKRETEITASFTVSLLADGWLKIELEEEDSALCLKNSGWDLELTNPDGKPETVLGGAVLPKLDYTR